MLFCVSFFLVPISDLVIHKLLVDWNVKCSHQFTSIKLIKKKNYNNTTPRYIFFVFFPSFPFIILFYMVLCRYKYLYNNTDDDDDVDGEEGNAIKVRRMISCFAGFMIE